MQFRQFLSFTLPKVCKVLPGCSIPAPSLGIGWLYLANHFFALQHSACEPADFVETRRQSPTQSDWNGNDSQEQRLTGSVRGRRSDLTPGLSRLELGEPQRLFRVATWRMRQGQSSNRRKDRLASGVDYSTPSGGPNDAEDADADGEPAPLRTGRCSRNETAAHGSTANL